MKRVKVQKREPVRVDDGKARQIGFSSLASGRIIADEAQHLMPHQRETVREVLTGRNARIEVLDVSGGASSLVLGGSIRTLLASGAVPRSTSLLELAKDVPVPARQNFSVSVDFFPYPKMPPPVTAYKLGPWAACAVCGEPTRAIHHGHLFFFDDPQPQHLLCRPRLQVREAMNRHDRRRAGLPRPPMPDDVRAEWGILD